MREKVMRRTGKKDEMGGKERRRGNEERSRGKGTGQVEMRRNKKQRKENDTIRGGEEIW